mmetsp:Transcript_8512/g.14337  ORF Transcript_8512/g.14337 Transcript_8512/m.14337 type:complete len:126 (+) Transcript_8512:42-419(+)
MFGHFPRFGYLFKKNVIDFNVTLSLVVPRQTQDLMSQFSNLGKGSGGVVVHSLQAGQLIKYDKWAFQNYVLLNFCPKEIEQEFVTRKIFSQIKVQEQTRPLEGKVRSNVNELSSKIALKLSQVEC